MGVSGWRCGLVVGVFGVMAWGTVSAQVSPLNLSPGFPTQLDDAYPINNGAVAVQPAIRYDKTSSNEGRLNQTIDFRWGVSSGLELFVGGTTFHGPLVPGAMDDPRALRAGLLYRLTKQTGSDGVVPSLAIRTSAQIPVYGPGKNPALRGELLASWDLSGGWYGHVNAGYQVAPEGQPGLQSPGQNSVWYGRAGLVKALWYDIGLIADAVYGQDPNRIGGNLLTPEIGMTWGITREWILTLGISRDFGGGATQATVRGNVGVTWVW